MKKFLRNKKGETLVETLAAILIFTMASIILYSMVTTAAKINRQAREKDELIKDQIHAAETAQVSVGQGTVTMVLNKSDGTPGTEVLGTPLVVDIFSDDKDGSIYSYFKHVSGGEEH